VAQQVAAVLVLATAAEMAWKVMLLQPARACLPTLMNEMAAHFHTMVALA